MKRRLDVTMPEQIEQQVLSAFPGLDSDVDRIQNVIDQCAGKMGIEQPEWCNVCMTVALDIARERGIVSNPMDEKDAGWIWAYKLAAILAWRKSKVIYEFDNTLAEELKPGKTEPFVIPSDVVHHAPYQCVYVRGLPGMPEWIDGAFFLLEWDWRHPSDTELRIIYCSNDTDIFSLYYCWGPCSESRQGYNENGHNVTYDPLFNQAYYQKYWECCPGNFLNHVNMFAYLCSEKPDVIREMPSPKTIGAGHCRKAKRNDVQYVGRYVGSILRKARIENAASTVQNETGKTVQPHMRRAHWHLYRVGKGRKKTVLKWLHPIFVNSEYANEIPTSIHGVEN